MVDNKNNESPANEAKADKLRSFCNTARQIDSKATEKLNLFYVGKGMLSKAIAQNSSTLFILTLFLVACPYALLQYAGWVGLYDEWICIAAVIGCVAATNKMGCWFVPLICTIAIFTHYEFVFLYLPAILSPLVYLYFSKGKKVGSLISGLLTFITSFISAVY